MNSDNITEIGIGILLPKAIEIKATEIRNQLYNIFSKNGLLLENIENNYFHISLYQLAIQSSKIDLIKDRLDKLSVCNNPITIKLDGFLTDTQKRIFWSATTSKSDSIITKLHCSIIENMKNLRSNQLMRQIKKASLSSEQAKLIKEYGIFWNLPNVNFNPHITIIYNSGKDRKNLQNKFIKISELINNTLIPETEFQVEKLCLIELGKGGNALKLLHVSPIRIFNK